MSTHTTRPGIPVQSPRDADCLHSRAPFDQGFHAVSRRADLSSDAKVVHAFLVSLYRSGKDKTQREIGADLGLTRHRIWAAIRELVEREIVTPIRYGLGRPNGYVLVGIAQADLDGTSKPETGVRPVRKSGSGQSGNPTRARHSDLKEGRRMGDRSPVGGYIRAETDPRAFTTGELGRLHVQT